MNQTKLMQYRKIGILDFIDVKKYKIQSSSQLDIKSIGIKIKSAVKNE